MINGASDSFGYRDNRVKENSEKAYQLMINDNQGVVQRVFWAKAANRAPLDEIRDFESGAAGHRPMIDQDKLRDFKKVQDILHDDGSVNHHMARLNRDIEAILGSKDNKLTPREALLSVLKDTERLQGYHSEVGTITADDGTNPKLGAQKLSGNRCV
ncbi:MAG: hypothetical protein ACKVKQ_05905 [Flavobacteriales bacterium]